MELNTIELNRSGSNSETKNTGPDWFDKLAASIVATLGFLSCAFWWPTLSVWARFAFLCFFPGIFPFCYALARSAPSPREQRKRRIITLMLVIHVALLAGLVLWWKVFSSKASVGNPDVVFSFMGVEVAAMILLGRFYKEQR
jgi:hypothetical protein